MKEKCIVMFSGGLDSRLALKIMQEQGFDVIAVFFKLPFIKNVGEEIKKFVKNKVRLKIFDCTKGNLLKDYLKIIKNPKYKRGAGINPCIDCRIFILKKAKEFAREKGIKIVVTGEVLGQRPISQTRKATEIIDKEVDVKITRPLIEFGISGRQRKRQIALAEKFQISYPAPAGGCLLCEKELKEKLKILIEKNLINGKTLPLINLGRHFFIGICWFVIGRNEKENKVIEKFRNCVKSEKGKPAVYYSKKICRKFAENLQEDYKTGGGKKYSCQKI
jgi:tRNA-uridine 2-sulfurtransferase